MNTLTEAGTDRLTRKQVDTAGKLIRGTFAYGEVTPDLVAAYTVAHRWRALHMFPVRRVRAELDSKAARVHSAALTAGRLKTFQSLRRKLKRLPHSLHQIQDIAGCRAIMPTIVSMDVLTGLYRDGRSKFEFLREWDYVGEPKESGYRSRHMVVRFAGDERHTGGNNVTVELQLRTQLQHAWATAVEAVGMVRREDLKSSRGDADWLRFFALMSAEFAMIESRPGVPGVSERHKERVEELRDLDDRIGAVKNLESYNRILRYAEDFRSLDGQTFVITYDLNRRRLSISPYSTFSRAESQIVEEMTAENDSTVRVSIDRAIDLRAAYPNYFLDVRKFTERLRNIIYQPTPFLNRTARKPKYDLSFLKDYDLERKRFSK